MHVRHDSRNKLTFAMELPKRDILMALRSCMDNTGKNPVVRIPFGLARLNPIDKHYIKKIGRETALKNVQETDAELISVLSNNGIIFAEFKIKVGALTFFPNCKLTVGHDTPHLTHIGD